MDYFLELDKLNARLLKYQEVCNTEGETIKEEQIRSERQALFYLKEKYYNQLKEIESLKEGETYDYESENKELKKELEDTKKENENLLTQVIENKDSQTIGHQQNEIETLKSEKEFLMQTINALTKLTNNLIK